MHNRWKVKFDYEGLREICRNRRLLHRLWSCLSTPQVQFTLTARKNWLNVKEKLRPLLDNHHHHHHHHPRSSGNPLPRMASAVVPHGVQCNCWSPSVATTVNICCALLWEDFHAVVVSPYLRQGWCAIAACNRDLSFLVSVVIKKSRYVKNEGMR